ncbi:MAG: pseudouridine synthase [Candidatus Delongbacteria bacterium]|jgi:tRNA pseudouridine65 synthase|nr:pseudouridine synthase [Candidatus Delongbacteria bacterium]
MEIAYQGTDYVVIDKPAGLPVNKNRHMTLDAEYVNKIAGKQWQQNIFNPHKLDAKTSGLLILCFNKETTALFNTMFARQEIKKSYGAIVKGDVPEKGIIETPVYDRKKKKKLPAVTRFERLQTVYTGDTDKSGEDLYLNLLRIQPETGRWHQIRQHLSSLKYDIIGDTQHGDWDLNKSITASFGFRRMFLHASELSFPEPGSGKQVRVISPLPEEFDLLLEKMTT